MSDLIPLGQTSIQISPLGLGAWQWGDRFVWNYGRTHTYADTQAAFQTAIANGVNWFDSAEVYGMGVSERLLGAFIRGASSPALAASKFFPFPWRVHPAQLQRALRGSLRRLGLPRVALYQIHWPFSLATVETWAAALAAAVHGGLAQAVGVSNYNRSQMLRSETALAQRGVPLASNQVPYSLLNRGVERSGLLQTCLERNITLIAYSPLAQGLLSGKYTPQTPPPGLRGSAYRPAYLARIQPLIALLKEIGAGQGGKTPAQAALNWLICKGAAPIPGAKNARQAQESAGALGWRLTPEEVAALDKVSDQVSA